MNLMLLVWVVKWYRAPDHAARRRAA